MFNPENAQNEIDFLARASANIQHWRNLDLTIPPTVYPPKEDTGLLHDVLSEIQPFGSKNLLEIGSGSGALSIASAKMGWDVDACDINPYAVLATKNNAEQADAAVRVFEGGIGPNENGNGQPRWRSQGYDLVLWNMPYIPALDAEQLLGPMEEAALLDTHPVGLLDVFASKMAGNQLCKMNGMALLVCRGNVGWMRSVDVLRRRGLAARIIRSMDFEDGEIIHVIATWHPHVFGKHHQVREIDSTNAELLRGDYSSGDSIVAQIQTEGRGRHGNQWQDHSGSFKGSWMLNPSSITEISSKKQLEVAYEIHRAFSSEPIHLQTMHTKWPNDLLVRRENEKLWRKCGGILFQSYSKGMEQRIVIGIGLNTSAQSLSPGQGCLEEINMAKTPSELFMILNAVIGSLFEPKQDLPPSTNHPNLELNSVLKECLYRNKICVLVAVNEQAIVLSDQSGNRFSIENDDELNWTNLHPQ